MGMPQHVRGSLAADQSGPCMLLRRRLYSSASTHTRSGSRPASFAAMINFCTFCRRLGPLGSNPMALAKLGLCCMENNALMAVSFCSSVRIGPPTPIHVSYDWPALPKLILPVLPSGTCHDPLPKLTFPAPRNRDSVVPTTPCR